MKKVTGVSPVKVEVMAHEENVVMIFDKAVAWIGLDPIQAIKTAEQMKALAVEILRSSPPTSGSAST